jgi:hypothetical protein
MEAGLALGGRQGRKRAICGLLLGDLGTEIDQSA